MRFWTILALDAAGVGAVDEGAVVEVEGAGLGARGGMEAGTWGAGGAAGRGEGETRCSCAFPWAAEDEELGMGRALGALWYCSLRRAACWIRSSNTRSMGVEAISIILQYFHIIVL